MNATPEQAKAISVLVDEQIKNEGLPPIQKGKNRFEFIVSLTHQSQRQFAFTNSYCVVWQDWILVFADQDTKIFNKSELAKFSMMNRDQIDQQIPVIEMNNVK
jgi:hypothetical protein